MLTCRYVPSYNLYVFYYNNTGLTLDQKEYLRINKIDHTNHYAIFLKNQEKELSLFLLRFSNATMGESGDPTA